MIVSLTVTYDVFKYRRTTKRINGSICLTVTYDVFKWTS